MFIITTIQTQRPTLAYVACFYPDLTAFTGLLLGSPGLLVKPMSSLFRSATDRASVTVEENHDGRGTWGRVGTVVHRLGRRRARRQPCPSRRADAHSCAVPSLRDAESSAAQ